MIWLVSLSMVVSQIFTANTTQTLNSNTMSTTKETTELIKALSKLAIRTVANLKDDGRVSFAEGLAYMADLGVIREGFAGVAEIPKELADLDSEEMQALRGLIVQGLKDNGVTYRIQDIADALIQWLYDTIKVAIFIKNAPPTALPA